MLFLSFLTLFLVAKATTPEEKEFDAVIAVFNALRPVISPLLTTFPLSTEPSYQNAVEEDQFRAFSAFLTDEKMVPDVKQKFPVSPNQYGLLFKKMWAMLQKRFPHDIEHFGDVASSSKIGGTSYWDFEFFLLKSIRQIGHKYIIPVVVLRGDDQKLNLHSQYDIMFNNTSSVSYISLPIAALHDLPYNRATERLEAIYVRADFLQFVNVNLNWFRASIPNGPPLIMHPHEKSVELTRDILLSSFKLLLTGRAKKALQLACPTASPQIEESLASSVHSLIHDSKVDGQPLPYEPMQILSGHQLFLTKSFEACWAELAKIIDAFQQESKVASNEIVNPTLFFGRNRHSESPASLINDDIAKKANTDVKYAPRVYFISRLPENPVEQRITGPTLSADRKSRLATQSTYVLDYDWRFMEDLRIWVYVREDWKRSLPPVPTTFDPMTLQIAAPYSNQDLLDPETDESDEEQQPVPLETKADEKKIPEIIRIGSRSSSMSEDKMQDTKKNRVSTPKKEIEKDKKSKPENGSERDETVTNPNNDDKNETAQKLEGEIKFGGILVVCGGFLIIISIIAALVFWSYRKKSHKDDQENIQ